jgi:hypothetical protein
MRLTAETRQRVLSAVRHAAIAAGVGVGWLLLSGQSASADSHSGPQLPAVSGVVSSLQAVVQPAPSVIQDASVALPKVTEVQKPVSEVQGALSGGITQTTTALASSVEALPSAVGPVLSGPLEPLAPVVDHTASGLGSALTDVGGGVASTVETPVPVSVPEVIPVQAPATAGAPTTSDASASAAEDSPAAADNLVALADTSTDALPATASPIVPLGLNWSQIWSQTAEVTADVLAADSPASPADGQDQHQLPPPSAPPGSSAGGSDGTVGGGPNAASLAGGLLLSAPLFLSGRRHPLSALVPPTPAFDPGSTPD